MRQAFLHWIVVFGLAWLLTVAFWRILPQLPKTRYLGKLVNLWFFAASGVFTAWFTYTEMREEIQLALQSGEEVRVWVQVVNIATGVLLLYLAWRLWRSAVEKESDAGFVLRGLAALALIVAGWLLIGEVPAVIQAGDEDVWLGLKVTVFYSMGTIPFQLSIGMLLAFLLFQNVRFREFFRVVYFLPYVTPAVASAAVFRLLFGPRSSSPVNALISFLGVSSQRWLQEPRGLFQLIGHSFGWEIPPWAGGPSLALVVIIIYSIWTYVGYDTVIYLAGLGNIPFEINEAAAIDGASRWQIFRHITFPLLSPTTYFLSLIAVIGTFKAFNHIFVMRDALALGTVDTFSVAIFDEFFTRTRYGYASAMAFVLFAVILSLTYVNNKVQGSRVFYG